MMEKETHDTFVFTEKESEDMMAAYSRAIQSNKGAYETLYAVASVILRSRLKNENEDNQ